MIKLYDAEAAAKKAVKDATTKLEAQALAQYAKLTTEDVQALVIDDKWGGTIRARVGAEVTALGQALVARLQRLADRYEATVASSRQRSSALSCQSHGASGCDGGRANDGSAWDEQAFRRTRV